MAAWVVQPNTGPSPSYSGFRGLQPDASRHREADPWVAETEHGGKTESAARRPLLNMGSIERNRLGCDGYSLAEGCEVTK